MNEEEPPKKENEFNLRATFGTGGIRHALDALRESTTKEFQFETIGEGIVFTTPVSLSPAQAKAFFERLGVEFDLTELDGQHCLECSFKECLEGHHFKIVSSEECDCPNPECHEQNEEEEQ